MATRKKVPRRIHNKRLRLYVGPLVGCTLFGDGRELDFGSEDMIVRKDERWKLFVVNKEGVG